MTPSPCTPWCHSVEENGKPIQAITCPLIPTCTVDWKLVTRGQAPGISPPELIESKLQGGWLQESSSLTRKHVIRGQAPRHVPRETSGAWLLVTVHAFNQPSLTQCSWSQNWLQYKIKWVWLELNIRMNDIRSLVLSCHQSRAANLRFWGVVMHHTFHICVHVTRRRMYPATAKPHGHLVYFDPAGLIVNVFNLVLGFWAAMNQQVVCSLKQFRLATFLWESRYLEEFSQFDDTKFGQVTLQDGIYRGMELEFTTVQITQERWPEQYATHSHTML